MLGIDGLVCGVADSGVRAADAVAGRDGLKQKSRPASGGGSGAGVPYFAIWYTRSPCSFLMDSTASPIFLVRLPEMKPRMLWFCQSVALAISAIVAPSLRRRRSRTIAFF